MDNIDPQVQIKIIELAWEFAKNNKSGTGAYAQKSQLEIFDIAYKALTKTIGNS